MKLAVEGQQVSGTYTTAVGEAQGRYPIVGAVDTESYNKSQAVGLVVIWSNEQGSSHIVMNSHQVDPDDPATGWGTISYKVGILAACPIMLVK
jgi:hypothetical protein